MQSLGAGTVIDYRSGRFEDLTPAVDIVLDTVGGETLERSLAIIKPGGILVSAVSEAAPQHPTQRNVRTVFFLVDVTTERLNAITTRFDHRRLIPRVGSVLPLEEARAAHQMLAGAPHKPGKIVLEVADLD